MLNFSVEDFSEWNSIRGFSSVHVVNDVKVIRR